MIDNNPTYGSGNPTCLIELLRDAALQWGKYYLPEDCDDKLALVLVPCGNLPSVGQVTIGQVTILPGMKRCPPEPCPDEECTCASPGCEVCGPVCACEAEGCELDTCCSPPPPPKKVCRTCETGYGFATDDGQLLGRAVQVDSIETRVESAYGFSA